MDPGTPGPALLLRKAQALVDRKGVDTSEKGELSGKQAAAGVCRLARLMAGVDGERRRSESGVEATLPRTHWLWLIPSLRKPVPGKGKTYDDVRNLNEIKLPDTIPPAKAVQCAKFLLANLNDTPVYRDLLVFGGDGLTKEAGLAKAASLTLCRYCYGGGGVCCESQRAHHLQKSRRGGKDHAKNVEAAGTTGIGSGGAAARATRKRTRQMERVERELRRKSGPEQLAGLQALAEKDKVSREQDWYKRMEQGQPVNAASIPPSSRVTESVQASSDDSSDSSDSSDDSSDDSSGEDAEDGGDGAGATGEDGGADAEESDDSDSGSDTDSDTSSDDDSPGNDDSETFDATLSAAYDGLIEYWADENPELDPNDPYSYVPALSYDRHMQGVKEGWDIWAQLLFSHTPGATEHSGVTLPLPTLLRAFKQHGRDFFGGNKVPYKAVLHKLTHPSDEDILDRAATIDEAVKRVRANEFNMALVMASTAVHMHTEGLVKELVPSLKSGAVTVVGAGEHEGTCVGEWKHVPLSYDEDTLADDGKSGHNVFNQTLLNMHRAYRDVFPEAWENSSSGDEVYALGIDGAREMVLRGYFNEKDEWVALRDSARHVVYVTPLLFRGTTMIEDTATIDKRKRKVQEKVMDRGTPCSMIVEFGDGFGDKRVKDYRKKTIKTTLRPLGGKEWLVLNPRRADGHIYVRLCGKMPMSDSDDDSEEESSDDSDDDSEEESEESE